MKRQIARIGVNLTLLLLTLAAVAQDDSGNEAIAPGTNSSGRQPVLTVSEWIDEISDKGNCYITIEGTRDRFNELRSARFSFIGLEEKLSLDSVETILKDSLSEIGMTILRSEASEQRLTIFHIVDSELVDLEGYGLNQRISLDFQGNPVSLGEDYHDQEGETLVDSTGKAFRITSTHFNPGLIDIIGQTIPNIRSGILKYSSVLDIKVEVKAMDKTVRGILTECLPKNSPRVLWLAESSIIDGRLISQITFTDPHLRTLPGLLEANFDWSHFSISELNNTEELESPNEPISIEQFLQILGENVKCRFTLESFQTNDYFASVRLTPPEISEAFTVQQVEPLLFTSLNSLDFVIIQSASDRGVPVFHLVQKELVDLEDYALAEVVSIAFTGRIGLFSESSDVPPEPGLVEAINELTGGLKVQQGFFTFSGPSDNSTTVNVTAVNKTARQVFSESLSKTKTSPILWRASTDLVDDKPITSIRF